MKEEFSIAHLLVTLFLCLLIVAFGPRCENFSPKQILERNKPQYKDSLELPSNGWQLIGEIDGCKLYQKCIPVHEKDCKYCECNLIRWSICEDNNSALK